MSCVGCDASYESRTQSQAQEKFRMPGAGLLQSSKGDVGNSVRRWHCHLNKDNDGYSMCELQLQYYVFSCKVFLCD